MMQYKLQEVDGVQTGMRHTKYSMITAFFVVGLYAGCGTTDTNNINSRSVVLKTFEDGSGVARMIITEDGVDYTAMVMASDIESFDEAGGIDSSNLIYDTSNAYGDFYSGTAIINGAPIAVRYYEQTGGEAAIYFASSASENTLVTIGEKPTKLPKGSYTYSGTNIIGARNGSYTEDGTFLMNVNFGTKKASLSGSTPNTAISGTNISINTNKGTFESKDLILYLFGTSYTASIDGSFHGDKAKALSGIYHEKAKNPITAGAIAGSR